MGLKKKPKNSSNTTEHTPKHGPPLLMEQPLTGNPHGVN